MIVPTVGRVVWFWRDGKQQTQPFAATVAYVHGPRMVNLSYTEHNGTTKAATSVTLVQDGDEVPTTYFAEWMPYQKGQAAKTEALEKQIGA